MSLRWRKDGRLLCAAKCEAEEGDCYIDDRLHYELSIEAKSIIPDPNESENGIWHWKNKLMIHTFRDHLGNIRIYNSDTRRSVDD